MAGKAIPDVGTHLFVQLLSPLPELLFAGRLANVLGHDGAWVRLVGLLGADGAARGGARVGLVGGV